MKALIFLIASLAAAPLTAATVINGSFEMDPGVIGDRGGHFDTLNGGGRSWDVWASVPGWSTSAGPGLEIHSNRTLGRIDAWDGSHYVELDSAGGRDTNSTIFQDIFLSSGQYALSFYYSPRHWRTGTNGIAYQVTAGAADLLSGGITGPDGDTRRGEWTHVYGSFVVPHDQQVRLSFAAVGKDDGLGGLIDDVSIAPIPVPASVWMLFAALGGLGLLRARRG